MRHHRPAHLWNTNTLTLGISMHALNKLMTTCTSTFAASSTRRGCSIDARNSCLIVGLHMDVSAAYARLIYLEGWMEWLEPESGFLRLFGPGLELLRSEVAQEESWRSPCAIRFVGRLRWHQARHQLAHEAPILFSPTSKSISISIHPFSSPTPMYILADFSQFLCPLILAFTASRPTLSSPPLSRYIHFWFHRQIETGPQVTLRVDPDTAPYTSPCVPSEMVCCYYKATIQELFFFVPTSSNSSSSPSPIDFASAHPYTWTKLRPHPISVLTLVRGRNRPHRMHRRNANSSVR